MSPCTGETCIEVQLNKKKKNQILYLVLKVMGVAGTLLAWG